MKVLVRAWGMLNVVIASSSWISMMMPTMAVANSPVDEAPSPLLRHRKAEMEPPSAVMEPSSKTKIHRVLFLDETLTNGSPSSTFNMDTLGECELGRHFLLAAIPAFSSVTCTLTCDETASGQGVERATYLRYDRPAIGSVLNDDDYVSGLCPHSFSFTTPGVDVDLYILVEISNADSPVTNGVLDCAYSGGTPTLATTPSPAPITTLTNGVASSSFDLYATEADDYGRMFLLPSVAAFSSVSCSLTCDESSSGLGFDFGRYTYYNFGGEARGSALSDDGFESGLCPHSISFTSPGIDLDLYLLVESQDTHSTITNGVIQCSHSGGTSTTATTPSPTPTTTLTNGVATSSFNLYASSSVDYGRQFLLASVPAFSSVSCTFSCLETSTGQGIDRTTTFRYDRKASGSILSDDGFDSGLCPHTFIFSTPGIDVDIYLYVETEDEFSTITDGVLQCTHSGGTPTSATTPSPTPTTMLTNGVATTAFSLYATETDDFARQFLLSAVPAFSSITCTFTCDETSTGQGLDRTTAIRYDSEATGSALFDDEYETGLCPHTHTFTTPGIDVDLYVFVETDDKYSTISNGVIQCTHSGGTPTTGTTPSPAPTISLTNGVPSSPFNLYASETTDYGQQFLLASVPAFSSVTCTFTCDETSSGQGLDRTTAIRYDSEATGSALFDDEYETGLCPHTHTFTTPGIDVDLYFFVETEDKHSTISSGVVQCTHSGGTPTTGTTPSPAPTMSLTNGVATSSFNLYASETTDYGQQFLLASVPAFSSVCCYFTCDETSSGQGVGRSTSYRFDSEATGSILNDDGYDSGRCPHSLSFTSPGIDLDLYVFVETDDKYSTISNGVLQCTHSGGTPTSGTTPSPTPTISLTSGVATSPFNLYASETTDYGQQYLLPAVPAFSYVKCILNCDEISSGQGFDRTTTYNYGIEATGSILNDGWDSGRCPHLFNFNTPGIDLDLYLLVETEDKYSTISNGILQCTHSGGTPTSATTPSPTPTTTLTNGVATNSFDLYATDTVDYARQFLLPSVPAFSSVSCTFTCDETSSGQGTERTTTYNYDTEATGSASNDGYDSGLCPHVFSFITPGIDLDLYLQVETEDTYSTISNGVVLCSHSGGTPTTGTTPSPTPITALSDGVASASFNLYATESTDYGRQFVLASVPANSEVCCTFTCEETAPGQGTDRKTSYRFDSPATGSFVDDDGSDSGRCPHSFDFIASTALDLYVLVETEDKYSTITNGVLTCESSLPTTPTAPTPTAPTAPGPTPTAPGPTPTAPGPTPTAPGPTPTTPAPTDPPTSMPTGGCGFAAWDWLQEGLLSAMARILP